MNMETEIPPLLPPPPPLPALRRMSASGRNITPGLHELCAFARLKNGRYSPDKNRDAMDVLVQKEDKKNRGNFIETAEILTHQEKYMCFPQRLHQLRLTFF